MLASDQAKNLSGILIIKMIYSTLFQKVKAAHLSLFFSGQIEQITV